MGEGGRNQPGLSVYFLVNQNISLTNILLEGPYGGIIEDASGIIRPVHRVLRGVLQDVRCTGGRSLQGV
jgi:hypothetical protein